MAAAGPINTGPREWDAETYDAISDPQFEWGMEVLERLDLRGDEDVLDAGCGSGRVTEQLLIERLPEGASLAVDGSEAMVAKARETRSRRRGAYLVADLSELELEQRVDADLLDRRPSTGSSITSGSSGGCTAALRPGGQRWSPSAAGRATSPTSRERSLRWRRAPSTSSHFEGMTLMWNFAAPEETEARLRARRLRRGPLLAGAEDGHARRARCASRCTVYLGPASRPVAGGVASALSSEAVAQPSPFAPSRLTTSASISRLECAEPRRVPP